MTVTSSARIMVTRPVVGDLQLRFVVISQLEFVTSRLIAVSVANAVKNADFGFAGVG